MNRKKNNSYDNNVIYGIKKIVIIKTLFAAKWRKVCNQTETMNVVKMFEIQYMESDAG